MQSRALWVVSHVLVVTLARLPVFFIVRGASALLLDGLGFPRLFSGVVLLLFSVGVTCPMFGTVAYHSMACNIFVEYIIID